VKRLTHLWPWALLLVAALLLLSACGDATPSPSTCYEVDIDHPNAGHSKTSKPRSVKPKAPAYRAPSRVGRRR
jgi:hypothetical protein